MSTSDGQSRDRFVIARGISWAAMLGQDERDATDEEVALIAAAFGPFLAADGEG
jgi:hypothetical protein